MRLETNLQKPLGRILYAIVFTALPFQGAPAQESTPQTQSRPKLRHPEDGWIDLSGFIDHSYGFVPLVVPITEPAVGLGAAGALVFIDKQKSGDRKTNVAPNITAVGGLLTEDGSDGLFALDSRHWLDGRLQTIVAIASMNIHLEYYGLGENSPLRDHPLPYQLDPFGGKAQVRYRLGSSGAKVGLAYSLAKTRIDFEAGDTAGQPSSEGDSQLGGLTPAITYDSRNNIFTPTRGIYTEARLGIYSEFLGSDAEYQMADLVFIGYHPLYPRVTVGAKGLGSLTTDATPFYLRPFIFMRGIAAMVYQGEQLAQIETEVRYQFWKRFSVVGFGGIGHAWSDAEADTGGESVTAFGTGCRYEIARDYGLHMGFDFAWGPDEFAFYVQFGSAWLEL